MMNDKVNHNTVEHYIRGERQANLKPEWLASLIDECRQQAKIRTEPPTSFQPLGPDEMYELLLRLLAGTFSKKDAQIFIDHLLFEPAFFQRILNFDQVMQRADDWQESELVTSQTFSDAQILSWIKNANKKDSGGSSSWLSCLKDVWRHLTRPSNKTVPVVIGGALVGLVAFFLLWPDGQSKEDAFKFLAEHDPYLSRTASGWRSDTSQTLNASFRKQIELYKIAMTDYVIADYKSALYSFHKAIEATDEITTENADISRDMMFYSALSHLYLARHEDDNRHDKLAIHQLEHARTMTEKFNLKGLDEIRFFLGLSHYRVNQTHAARAILSKIEKTSSFYKDSQLILEQIK